MSSPFLPGYQFTAQSPDQLARHFGAAFVENLQQLIRSRVRWVGPGALYLRPALRVGQRGGSRPGMRPWRRCDSSWCATWSPAPRTRRCARASAPCARTTRSDNEKPADSWWRWCWAVRTARVAHAHRFAPSLLKVDEIAPQQYNMVWKTPAQGISNVPLQPAVAAVPARSRSAARRSWRAPAGRPAGSCVCDRLG